MAVGWAGKTLQIDLSTGKISTAPWKNEAKMFMGGRGGNAWLFWKGLFYTFTTIKRCENMKKTMNK